MDRGQYNFIINFFQNLQAKMNQLILKQQTPEHVKEKINQLRKKVGQETFQNILKYDEEYGQQLEEGQIEFETLELAIKWSQASTCTSFINIVPDFTAEKMLCDISHIQFLNLTYLNLDMGSFYSIEAISWLSAPSLEIIKLSSSYLTHLKPLAKTNLKRLLILSLSFNRFQSCQLPFLNRMSVNRQKFYFLTLKQIHQIDSIKDYSIQDEQHRQLILQYQRCSYINDLFKISSNLIRDKIMASDMKYEYLREVFSRKFVENDLSLAVFSAP